MTQLIVQEVVESKSGKAWNVRSGDKWYSAYKDSHINLLEGKTIDAEIETFGKGGIGIKSFKIVEPGPSTQAPAASKGPLSSGVAPYWMPFASNVCAHAIAAGVVKEPSDLKAWLLAARDAAEAGNNGDIGL